MVQFCFSVNIDTSGKGARANNPRGTPLIFSSHEPGAWRQSLSEQGVLPHAHIHIILSFIEG